MPTDLFGGKASVQTAIYVFKVARPHEEDDLVTFLDFSEDGYTRMNRKKNLVRRLIYVIQIMPKNVMKK